MPANITNFTLEDEISNFFQLLSQSIRIQILLVIGEEEACVCHLEAFLGHRQAVISQHLMVWRDPGQFRQRAHGDQRLVMPR